MPFPVLYLLRYLRKNQFAADLIIFFNYKRNIHFSFFFQMYPMKNNPVFQWVEEITVKILVIFPPLKQYLLKLS